MVLVGVYGTLKQGHYNHKVHIDQSPVFAQYVELQAEMYTNGRYPMLVKSHNSDQIYLEIYEVTQSQLSSMDDLETPFGYHREQHDIGKFSGVWIYFFTKGIPPEDFKLVEAGNFVKEIDWNE